MKTKFIFEESDLEAGMYFIKNTSPKGSTDLGFARTVTYQLGYTNNVKIMAAVADDNEKDKRNNGYMLSNCFTDGWAHHIGTKAQIAEYLNENDMRPLSKAEAIALMSDRSNFFLSEY